MEIFYTCLENQLRDDGTRGLLYDHYTDEAAALAKYFTVCSAAALSGIPYHAAAIWTSDSRLYRQEIFDRRAQPQPELVEE